MNLTNAYQNYFAPYWRGLAHLFFPNICPACRRPLWGNEDVLCTSCEFMLPKTDYHVYADNPIEKKLWGRVPVKRAASFLFFEKGSDIQSLFKHMKYHGRKEIGESLGFLYGQDLIKDQSELTKASLIFPVPLHPKKKQRRGYNQSDYIAKGLSRAMQISWRDDVLERTVHTTSQTGKDRIQRWEDMQEIFRVRHPEEIRNKHIILTDDVITTGATIEACASVLIQIEGVSVSVLTLACAV